MLWFGHNASRYDGSDTLHSADIMQMQNIQNGARAQLHRNVIIEGVTALPQAHKRAQTRQSHESLPLRPLPPEQRSSAAIMRVLVLAILVLGGAVEIDPLIHHSRAAVAMPEVDNSGRLVTLQAFEDHVSGVRIHSSTWACWAKIWHLCI